MIFDLDGTLVDTVPDLAAALNQLLREQSRPSLADAAIRTMIGDGVAKLVERGFAATGGWPGDPPALVRRFVAIYEGAIADRSRPFAGVPETLQRLAAAGIRLGVCTNKPDLATENLLRALDLRRHFAAVAGGDRPNRKPDPRHLLGVLDELKTAPARAVMVGDAANDVNAARAAGVPVVAVSFGYTPIPARELGADAVIDRYEDLPALLGL